MGSGVPCAVCAVRSWKPRAGAPRSSLAGRAGLEGRVGGGQRGGREAAAGEAAIGRLRAQRAGEEVGEAEANRRRLRPAPSGSGETSGFGVEGGRQTTPSARRLPI